MTAHEEINLMIQFGIFVVALVAFVASLSNGRKK
ncbi:putative holin-like toxin [Brevibacillus humidisoli]|nr:putative holin-like toxin [Brevibacillus humidisoli]UFJ40228.1 putative holin-like toxin [Brevibacillus humidisoli]